MKYAGFGFLRTGLVRYAQREKGWRGRFMVAVCLLFEVLVITAFVTSLAVLSSLFELT